MFPFQLPSEQIGAVRSRDPGSQQGFPDISERNLDGFATDNRLEMIFFQSMIQRRGITENPVGLVLALPLHEAAATCARATRRRPRG